LRAVVIARNEAIQKSQSIKALQNSSLVGGTMKQSRNKSLKLVTLPPKEGEEEP